MLRAMATDSRGLQYLITAWLVITASLIVVSVMLGIDSAAGDQVRAAGIELLTEDSPTTHEARSDPVDLHPSVRYGTSTWSLVKARVVPAGASTTGRPIVVAEMRVGNDGTVAARVADSDVAIVWTDGRRHEADRFEQVGGRRRFTVSAGETVPVTVVFKPPVLAAPDLAELTLEIGQPGRTPAILPLAGPVPEPEFPIAGSIDPIASVLPDRDNPPRRLVVTPRAVAVTLDAGPYRAAIGQRLVLVEVAVTRASATTRSAFRQPGFWELDVEGRRVAPSRVTPIGEATSNGDRLRLVFVLDSQPEGMALIVAADTPGPVTYPIHVPALIGP